MDKAENKRINEEYKRLISIELPTSEDWKYMMSVIESISPHTFVGLVRSMLRHSLMVMFCDERKPEAGINIYDVPRDESRDVFIDRCNRCKETGRNLFVEEWEPMKEISTPEDALY